MTRREFWSGKPFRTSTDTDYFIRINRQAMACRFEITLPGEDAHLVGAARQALDEVDTIEAHISAFRGSTALARVNRCAAAAAVTVDQSLFDLLVLCRGFWTETDGAFDVTSTPLSRCWGFMQREPRIPTDGDIAAALDAVGMQHVEIDAEGRRVRFTRAGMSISFGAIGKGWALDRIATGLPERGVTRALLSAGHSSVLAVGHQPRGWAIDLTSPRVSERLARVELRHGAVGTSGAGEQFIEIDGIRYGHVLDPRTGRPTTSGLLSVSVLTDSAAASDALSTAFLVGGADLAHRYCEQHHGVMAILTSEEPRHPTHIIGNFPGASVTLNEATTCS